MLAKPEDVVAVQNGGSGFEIDGDRNKFKRITAVGNGAEGFLADDGAATTISLGVFLSHPIKRSLKLLRSLWLQS